jgi:hypothetical protein
MLLIIEGRRYYIASIEPAIDQAFIDLHASYLSNQPLHWESFKAKAIKFFDNNYSNQGAIDLYFNNFTIIWNHYLSKGLLEEAEQIWKLALEPALAWESNNPGKRIHKGTPYYFWGIVAIKRGDLDRGYILMHEALQEDVLTHGTSSPDTPAFAFAALNYLKVDQAFRHWVLQEAKYLDKRIDEYRTSRGFTLTLKQFQSDYLETPPSIESIYLLAYNVARLLKLDNMPPYILSSPFAGQLLQNLLFDMVQVVNTTIKHKNQTKWKMIDHINFLSINAGIQLTKKKLKEANKAFQSDFSRTAQDLLDSTFTFNDGSTPNLLQSDLIITYGLRNRGAHNISSSPLLWQRYGEIRRSVFNTFFLSVEILY